MTLHSTQLIIVVTGLLVTPQLTEALYAPPSVAVAVVASAPVAMGFKLLTHRGTSNVLHPILLVDIFSAGETTKL
jgi:hypothetical protein